MLFVVALFASPAAAFADDGDLAGSTAGEGRTHPAARRRRPRPRPPDPARMTRTRTPRVPGLRVPGPRISDSGSPGTSSGTGGGTGTSPGGGSGSGSADPGTRRRRAAPRPPAARAARVRGGEPPGPSAGQGHVPTADGGAARPPPTARPSKGVRRTRRPRRGTAGTPVAVPAARPLSRGLDTAARAADAHRAAAVRPAPVRVRGPEGPLGRGAAAGRTARGGHGHAGGVRRADGGVGRPVARVVTRVLPLGTGLVLTGLGLAFLGLRLRRH
ncbi:hypothetical protein NKH77_27105 [Streptomyces sp. M19]